MDAPEFTKLLGKREQSAEVVEFVMRYGPCEIQESPPFRKYLCWPSKGIDLLFVNDEVKDVQLFVQGSQGHRAFDGALPFGLKMGQKQHEVHAILGLPTRFDEFDSKYLLEGSRIRVTICFDSDSALKYLSIGFPIPL